MRSLACLGWAVAAALAALLYTAACIAPPAHWAMLLGSAL